MKEFKEMVKKVEQNGKIDSKTKHLIMFAIGITKQCKPCMNYHLKEAKKLKASKQEIKEAAECAVVMGGGPAFMHCKKYLK